MKVLHFSLDRAGDQRARLAGVIEIVAKRIAHRLRHHDRAREMNHGFDRIAEQKASDEIIVADIAFNKLRIVGHRPAEAARQIVEDEDVLAGIEQPSTMWLPI